MSLKVGENKWGYQIELMNCGVKIENSRNVFKILIGKP